jgi:serine/threonine protein kinase
MPLDNVNGFVLGKRLGSGTYGTVFLANRVTDSAPLAIKVIPNIEKATKMETEVLQSIRHPFIVSHYSSFVCKQKVHICLEYMAGGTLLNRMQMENRIRLSEAKLYLAEIALGLSELHQRSIVYRDLKPENVMIGADGHLKLIDFGLASETRSCESVCGTADYLAPEVIEGKRYGCEVDWWALGILFFEMLFGRTPFAAASFERLKEKIVGKEVIVPDFGEEGWEIASLIHGLLEKDPRRRFGFEDIVKHSLFEGVSFAEILEKQISPKYVPEV